MIDKYPPRGMATGLIEADGIWTLREGEDYLVKVHRLDLDGFHGLVTGQSLLGGDPHQFEMPLGGIRWRLHGWLPPLARAEIPNDPIFSIPGEREAFRLRVLCGVGQKSIFYPWEMMQLLKARLRGLGLEIRPRGNRVQTTRVGVEWGGQEECKVWLEGDPDTLRITGGGEALALSLWISNLRPEAKFFLNWMDWKPGPNQPGRRKVIQTLLALAMPVGVVIQGFPWESDDLASFFEKIYQTWGVPPALFNERLARIFQALGHPSPPQLEIQKESDIPF